MRDPNPRPVVAEQRIGVQEDEASVGRLADDFQETLSLRCIDERSSLTLCFALPVSPMRPVPELDGADKKKPKYRRERYSRDQLPDEGIGIH